MNPNTRMEQDMANTNPPVSASAAAHAERIRARDEGAATRSAGKSTAEHYAERILPGYRADEELREQARLNELRARGVLTAGADSDVEDEDGEEYGEEDLDEDDAPQSTAERYARRERQRQQAERKANLIAHRGSTWALGEQAGRLVR